jgi:hypothetical protein
MADRIAISGAAAGTQGGSYRKILTFLAKAAGNYVFNDTNFSGLGVYLPCAALIQVTPGAAGAGIQVSNDNGTTWFGVTVTTTAFNQYLYLDTASTFRIVITTNAADVRIFIQ